MYSFEPLNEHYYHKLLYMQPKNLAMREYMRVYIEFLQNLIINFFQNFGFIVLFSLKNFNFKNLSTRIEANLKQFNYENRTKISIF